MHRTVLCVLTFLAAWLSCLQAQAIIIVGFGDHLMSSTDSQTFPILITSFPSEEITAVDLYLQNGNGYSNINGPYATQVDLLTGTIFSAVSSTQAQYGDPYDVYNGTSTGLMPAFAVFANATTGPNADVPASGILAQVTWQTNNAAPGVYPILFYSDDLGPTLMAKTTGLLEPGYDYFLVPGTITVTPEPSTAVLGLLAAAGMGGAVARSRRYQQAYFARVKQRLARGDNIQV